MIDKMKAGFDLRTLKFQIRDLCQAIEIGYNIDYNLGCTIRDIANMLRCYSTLLQCSHSQGRICFWNYNKSISYPRLTEDVIEKITQRIDQQQTKTDKVSYDLISGVDNMG